MAEAAEARAKAERQARRLQLGLVASGLAVTALVAMGTIWLLLHRYERQAHFDELLLQAGSSLELAVHSVEPAASARWMRARIALGQVEEVASGGIDDERATRLQDLRARSDVAEKVRTLVTALETIRGNRADTSDPGKADRDYQSVFHDFFKEDLESLDPKQASKELSKSPAKVEIAAALDDWAFLRLKAARSRNPSGWRQLMDVARTTDPDEWRDALRAQFGQWDPARLKLLAGTEARADQPAASLILLARALTESGLPDLAAEVFREAWHHSPGDFWVNYELGTLSFDQKYQRHFRPEEEIRFLTAAVGIRPNSAIAHNRLGIVLGHEGKLDEALREFRSAVRLKGDLAGPRNNLGSTLRVLERYNEAIPQFREAISLLPDFVDPHVGLGRALLEQGKFDEAITEYRTAVKLKPESLDAHVGLGDALLKLEKPADAVAEYELAIRLQPDDPRALENLDVALKAQGKVEEARATYRRLVELTRASKPSKVTLNNIAYACLRGGEFAAAAEILGDLLAKDPDFYVANATRGELLVMQCQFASALAQLNRATELYRRQGVALPPDYPDFIKLVDRLASRDQEFRKLAGGLSISAGEMSCLTLAPQARQQGLHATAALLYQAMFFVDSNLANDLASSRRYDAACAAILASSSRRPDDQPVDEADRSAWRRQAFLWLTRDLAAWQRRLKSGKVEMQATIRETLMGWQTNRDLASVRGPEALAQLPEKERNAWSALWEQVSSSLKQEQGHHP
jgi:tetratricopeptide (TPR) repeat protein